MNVKHWLGKGIWTILDQGLFAISNFILNIILARWLSESEYGSFSLAFSIFLLLGVLFNALMVEPMMVLGAAKYEGKFKQYIEQLSYIHWTLVAALLSLVGLIIALCFYQNNSFHPLLLLAALSGLMFFQWLLRRSCYLIMQPKIAATGGLIYLVVMMTALYFINKFFELNALYGISIMAIASLTASIWIGWRLCKGPKTECTIPRRELYIEHWNYGKWALGSNVLSWVPGNIYFVLLGYWFMERTPGDLRAIFNLALPMLQLIGAFGPMLIPLMVQASKSGNLAAFTKKVSLLTFAVTVAYAIGLSVLGRFLMRFLYGEKYQEYTDQLWIIGILPIFAALVLVYGTAIRAMEKPKLIFKSYIGVNIVCLMVGVPLTYYQAVQGSVIGMLAATITNSVILYLLYQKHKDLPVAQ